MGEYTGIVTLAKNSRVPAVFQSGPQTKSARPAEAATGGLTASTLGLLRV